MLSLLKQQVFFEKKSGLQTSTTMTFLGINIPFNRKEFYNHIDQWIEYAVINYRWIFVCLFLLPASVCYEIYFALRTWLVFKLKSAPSKHQQKVRHVQQQVKNVHKKNNDVLILICKSIGCIAVYCFIDNSFRRKSVLSIVIANPDFSVIALNVFRSEIGITKDAKSKCALHDQVI